MAPRVISELGHTPTLPLRWRLSTSDKWLGRHKFCKESLIGAELSVLCSINHQSDTPIVSEGYGELGKNNRGTKKTKYGANNESCDECTRKY